MKEKIEHSIEVLKKGERLAVSLNPEGYYVAFSGGKDSQVMLELVKMAGVKYRAYYSVTTNDPPDNVYFIRKYYPEVVFVRPPKTYYQLIAEKGLPTMQRRFCCDIMKEGLGIGRVVLTGVRAEESKKRAGYSEVAVMSRRKEHEGRTEYDVEQMAENEHQCIKGKDKVMVRPILQWTEEEVWEFIRERGLPENPCYKLVGRVGCMFCPYSSVGAIKLYEETYPRFRELIIKALEKNLKYRRMQGDTQLQLGSAEEYYKWWKSKTSVKKWLAKEERKKRLKVC